MLLAYNRKPENPLRLLPAWQLYNDPAYGRLAGKCGVGNVYVLSAGWGLIRADFLTPDYDITFSYVKPEDRYKRRSMAESYDDFCMLPLDARAPIVFFGCKGYLPLFESLTSSIRAPKTVFFNSAAAPEMPGHVLKRFDTRRRTNWHYECAAAFVDGRISVDQS